MTESVGGSSCVRLMSLGRTPSSGSAPEPDALELRSLEVDFELRDVWEQLDRLGGSWPPALLDVTAKALRVAFARGRAEGLTEGRENGYADGYYQGREDARADGA